METLRQTAPRIKLAIVDEDYKKVLYRLGCISNELRDVRNNAMKSCIELYFRNQRKEIEDPRIANRKGKYSAFVSVTRNQMMKIEHSPMNLVYDAENQVIQKFNNIKTSIKHGNTNIPLFKDKTIYVRGLGTEKSPKSSLYLKDGNYYFRPYCLPILFKFINDWKDKSITVILDRIMSGEYHFSDSKLVKDGKSWYLHLSYKLEKEEHFLDADLVCGVDLGWKIPAYCGLSEGLERKALGDSDKLMRFKTQIKSRRRKLQKVRNEMKAGHGKLRSMQALNHLSNKEANFVQTFNHTISRGVIDFCIRNNAGTIHMEALTIGVKKSKFLTQYWSYYQLQQMVEYKAKAHGIEVKYIDPRYTSQTCSHCGNVDSENRLCQEKFRCTVCGHKSNADYNASVNIARSTNFVDDKDTLEKIEEDPMDKVVLKKAI